MRTIVRGFALSFIALTAADAMSTLFGLAAGNAREANAVVADSDGMLEIGRMLAVNAAMLVLLAGMLWWALNNRHRIDPLCLAQPHRALFSWLHLNPFGERNVPKTALVYIAMAPTVLMGKALASINNLLIGAGLPDLITPLAMAVNRLVEGPAAYWILIMIITMPLYWLGLHIAVWLVRRLDHHPARAAA